MPVTRRGVLGAASLAVTLPMTRTGRAEAPTIRIGVLNDKSGPYRDTGIGSYVAVNIPSRRFGIQGQGFSVEVIQRRPPEQARCRRSSRGNGSTATASMRSSTCRPPRSVSRWTGLPREEQGHAELRHRHRRPDRRAVQPEHRPLDLRHLHARHIDRRRHRQEGGDTWFFITADYVFGQSLERDDRGRHASRRQGAGQRRLSVPGHDGFLLFLCGPRLERRQSAGPGQCRRRH